MSGGRTASRRASPAGAVPGSTSCDTVTSRCREELPGSRGDPAERLRDRVDVPATGHGEDVLAPGSPTDDGRGLSEELGRRDATRNRFGRGCGDQLRLAVAAPSQDHRGRPPLEAVAALLGVLAEAARVLARTLGPDESEPADVLRAFDE